MPVKKTPSAKKAPFEFPVLPEYSPNLHIGTSGWAYAVWKPDFYPDKLPAKDFLRYYSTQLNAVEVNYTFRHMLSEKATNDWIAQTPAAFRFSIKAHQAITHFARLKNTDEVLRRFLVSLASLEQGGKLGPALFQLPPNMKADAGLLREFLAQLPRAMRSAFEFRHESWFSEETYKCLSDAGIALCVAETEDFQTPEVNTTKYSYYRLRKENYLPEERLAIAEKFSKLSSDREIYAFFKHEERPESPLYALDLLRTGQPRSAQ